MADEQQGTPPKLNWQLALIMGVSIGIGIGTSKAVQEALEPSIGKLGAVLVSIVAAGAVAGLVGMGVILVLKLLGKDRT
jgi:hypothetical protein